ncbi:asialoglycoprotein receptor 1-like [Xenopus tropicalis]|uniref:Asialoglycoprotein receptor 1-like n=2 Tax=Xenopus tropicalis TaxID=8364 RepID=A0A803JNE9_XENTR|nr:asialoglycoprotein receptor 1-like [Xenopus tropicalis]
MSAYCLDGNDRKKMLYLALWSRDLGRNLKLSPMPRAAVGDCPTDRSVFPGLEFRPLTDQASWGSDTLTRDDLSTNNLISKTPVRNHGSRWLLAGGIFPVILLFAAFIVLLPLYLQDRSYLQRDRQQMEVLHLNESDSVEEITECQEAAVPLSNNVSSLNSTLSLLQEGLIPELQRNQTQLLLELVGLETTYQNHSNQSRALQGTYEQLKGTYYFIPREGPLLQHCGLRDSESDSRVCPFCLSGWHFLGTSCYLLSSEAESWEESSVWCRKEGGHLVVINGTAEQDSVLELLNETVWIGLSDLEAEGDWRWEDGSHIESRFWLPGQPSNSGDDDCATLVPTAGWKADRCAKLYLGLCERSADELTLPRDASLS